MKHRFMIIVALTGLLLTGGCISAIAQSKKADRITEAIKAAKKAEKESRKAEKGVKTSEEVATHVQKLSTVDTRYLFGVATSFADSVTYVTMVAPVDSMVYDQNTKAPLGLDLYTLSFRNFLEAQGLKGYICSTFVCKTEKEAERRLTAVCKRVNKKKRTRLASADGFIYHRIATDFIYTNAGEDAGVKIDN
ncbi:MAG: hypothetical protein J6129_00890 [Bacteroidaceae bacterium]|nr:hypothetical protein [Bacteroidaceae bacterium]